MWYNADPMGNISLTTVGLLAISNFIMCIAWYGHLRNLGSAPLWIAIVSSWAIALAEYCFAVPANRIGARTMSLEQLKITQETVSLLIFIPFSVLIMKQPISWNYGIAMVCILAAVFFISRA